MVDLEAFAMIRNWYEIPIPSNRTYGEQMELLTVAKNGFLHYSWTEQNRSNAILQSCNIFNLTQHLKNMALIVQDAEKTGWYDKTV